MQDEGSTGEAGGPVRTRWDRRMSTAVVAAHEDVQVRGASQREFAASVGVPRSTLRYWLSRKAGLDADPELVAFSGEPVTGRAINTPGSAQWTTPRVGSLDHGRVGSTDHTEAGLGGQNPHPSRRHMRHGGDRP
jgi:hypothetical protein